MRTRRRVVITGLGVVAPNGIGKQAFWESLIAGKSGIDWITAFDASGFPTQIAGEVRGFVASDFMRARFAKGMGRFSQFAVASSRLAVEDAKLSLDPRLATRAVVCFGSSGGADIFESAGRDLQTLGPSGVSRRAALDFPPHAPAAYVSIDLGIKGRVMSVTSNCCTGLDVIYSAASQIASAEADIALVGSTEAPVTPTAIATFCALGAVSKRSDDPTKASRPYDLLRDGLVISEAGAALVLEELDGARQRGAKIYAEILGYAAASEAIDMRKGDLSGSVMAGVIQKAISSAGLDPCDIDHINAHGSSLPDFDVCDTNAFKRAFLDHVYRIPISSIKSMIGQPFSAAGTIQTVAACLALEAQVAPPTINQEVPDPRCDLDYVPNRSRVARIRTVLVNAHSFGGGCSALVVAKPSDELYQH